MFIGNVSIVVHTTTDNTITSPKENMTPAQDETTLDTYTKGLSFDIMFTSSTGIYPSYGDV